jgi:hypothetical protein
VQSCFLQRPHEISKHPPASSADTCSSAMGSSADLRVRAAVLDNACARGRLHVRAWQAAYRGQMPDAYLDDLSVEELG